MDFVTLCSKLANMDFTSDEYARVLTWLLEYRSESVKKEGLVLNDARRAVDEWRNIAIERNVKIDALMTENGQLKAALEEARSKIPATVKIELGEICRMVVGMRERKIDCIKGIRSGKLINDGSGDCVNLRLVKEIYEAVAASEGVDYAVPSQWNPMIQINTASSYDTVKREVEFIVKNFYPSHKIQISDE